MLQSRKVLLISAHFPPEGGGAVVRAYKMAKYLRTYGYQVFVLTCPPASDAIVDDSLICELPSDLQVTRSRTLFASDRLPLRYFRWVLGSLSIGKRLIREEGIEIMWTTSNPPPTHLLGYWLKQVTQISWIADFRDPWTQNMHQQLAPWRVPIERWMERNILATADIVTTVTPSFVQNFQAKFGDIIKRIELIYNGFDPDDYEDLEATLKDHKFIATYSGILYPMRSPKVLLEALAELIADGAVRREDVLLRFAGRFDLPGSSAHWDLVHRLRLEDVVEVMGQLPHKEALAALKASHLLLLVGDTLPDAGYYIPGKLYEYMAIARPILALHMEGDAQQIIETYNIGQVVHPSNKEGIKEAYLRFYRAWQEGKVIPDTEVVAVDLFSRRYQAYRLAELIEDLLA